MRKVEFKIESIPAILWGNPSEKVYLFVHGKLSSKEAAADLAEIAETRGYQTVSFDLPEHGERRNSPERCDIWNGMRDLRIVADHIFSNWKEVSLFACSLGAYFSLNALRDRPIRRCLFQSPIIDMDWLIRQMMRWFGITPERLAQEKEIETPIDTMTWDYYRYVQEHPVPRWDFPTRILYGGKDNLQPREVLQRFSADNHAILTVAENSEHAFMGEKDGKIVRDWIASSL